MAATEVNTGRKGGASEADGDAGPASGQEGAHLDEEGHFPEQECGRVRLQHVLFTRQEHRAQGTGHRAQGKGRG